MSTATMAEASQSSRTCSNEDRYVSKVNLRHEKHLKKQLNVLDKERGMKTRSLDADKRNFEEKVHRLNMNPSDRAHLSKDTHNMVATDKNKELDRLLKSLLHRPYESRAGYSYIEYLSKNMQPLVKRPLQWGINPPLSSSRSKRLLPPDVPGNIAEQKHNMLSTKIEGQSVSFSQRVVMPIKTKESCKQHQMVLPPIRSKVKFQQTRDGGKPVAMEPGSTYARRKESPTKQSSRPQMEQNIKGLGNQNTQENTKNKDVESQTPQLSSDSKQQTPGKKAKDKNVVLTMARLNVPSPCFYPSIVQAKPHIEAAHDQHYKSSSTDMESHSQINYALSRLNNSSFRRKSV